MTTYAELQRSKSALAYEKAKEIHQNILTMVVELGRSHYPIDVSPIRDGGSSRYGSAVKEGRFQIKLGYYGRGNNKIFKTRKGEVPYAEMKEYLTEEITREKQALEYRNKKSNIKAANTPAADAVRELAKQSSPQSYIGQYIGNGTYVAPSEYTEGKMNVQVSFGEVDEETARQIFDFVRLLKVKG